jgi:hypothetical protein
MEFRKAGLTTTFADRKVLLEVILEISDVGP